MKLVPKLAPGSFMLVGLDYLKVSNISYSVNSVLLMHLR